MLSQVQPRMAQANRSMEQIADLAGFGSARDVRRVWLKHKGGVAGVCAVLQLAK